MSMRTYTRTGSPKSTPQTQVIPGREAAMGKNNAGGVSFTLDKWGRLDRFLILGTEGGTYYVKEPKHTERNLSVVRDCIREDGVRVVNRIVEISQEGRAVKNDPAIYALAMCLKAKESIKTRQAAAGAVPKVCRIGTHLFHFAEAVKSLGGWGRVTHRAFENWYLGLPEQRLALQLAKYQSRDGWSHRDLLRKVRPKPDSPKRSALFEWSTKGIEGKEEAWLSKEILADEDLRLLGAFEQAKRAGTEAEIVSLIVNYDLPRECIPTQWLNSVAVWDALLSSGKFGMPVGALVRNLGKMTSIGLIKPMSSALGTVVAKLSDAEAIKYSRLHPLSVLVAMNTYAQGHGVRGKLTWQPVQQVVDVLDDAFYTAFGNVPVTGKRHLLALDVSGSMTDPAIANMPGISPRVGSAAMALVTAAVEPNHHIVGFTASGRHGGCWTSAHSHSWFGGGSGISPLSISPRSRLTDAVKEVSGLPFGATDCAMPMLYAMEKGLEVDTFVIYTDSETYAGTPHPSQALQQYRAQSGIDAKLIVVGMTASGFTIADPSDPGMLDVVGFDASAPNMISQFSQG